jgi:hypothetical protein
MAKAMTTQRTGQFAAKRALSRESAYDFSTMVSRKEWGVTVVQTKNIASSAPKKPSAKHK